MYKLKKPTLPNIEERTLYDYLSSIQELLYSLDNILNDIDTRLKKLEAYHA